MKKHLILIIFILFTCSIFAQGPQIIFEPWGYASLANYVRCMYQDSRGFLWVGTVNELRRFDGYDRVYYEPQPGDTTSISGTSIQCILEDHEGMLWIGTFSDGLNRYNRYTDKFTRYQHDENNPFSISNNRINAIYEDHEQNLWIGAADGLNKFDKKTNRFICHKQDGKWITSINEDESGILWITTWDGLFLFDQSQERFIPFGKYFEIEDVFKNKPIMICYRDSSDNFWIGTDDLYQFNPKTRQLIHYPVKATDRQPTYSDRITSIVDAGGFLWIGKRNGLYRLDKNSKTIIWHPHDPDNEYSICEDDITAILKDRSGCYWFSGWSNGVSKRNSIRTGVKYYLPNPFDGGSIKDGIMDLFLSKSGKIWIGTEANGFLSFDKHAEQFRLYQHDAGNPNSLSHNNVRCIIEDRNGFMWIGTYEGLNKFDPATSRFILYSWNSKDNNSLSHNRVQSLLAADDGSIYVGTSGGFNHLDPATGKFTRYLNDPNDPHSISNDFIPEIFEDSEHIIWVGTKGGGLNRFDPKTRQFTHYKNDPRDPFSISSNTVHAIYEFPYENRPTMWIGTEGGGLCRFDKETEQFFTYSQKDGLPGNMIRDIVSDKKGNLWLATVDNITRFNPNKMIVKNYEISAEMPVNPSTCLIDRDGEIFFGGHQGMVRFFPDSLKDNPYRPQIVITNFRINNRPAHLDTVITEKKRIVLSHKQNNLSFEFSALDFNRPEMNQYAYRMEGLDKEWVYTDATRRYADYTYINHGNYVFHVKGSNNDGVWNEEGTSLRIIITPPFWKTAWFRLLMLVMIIGLIYGIYRYRLNRLLELERMRIQIASDLHDDIGSTLTKIAVNSEIIQTTGEESKVRETSRKIGSMSREIISTLSDVVWSIDARNDSVGDLIDRMRDFIDTVFSPGSIQIDFQTRGLHFQQKINQSLRQNIYLIFKEAVNNAAKHSKANLIRIHLTNGEGIFNMEIADNGIGMDLNQDHPGHHGLENMKSRATRIGGDLRIEIQQGTLVTLTAKAI
jgi:ligand-binding sensor domain-containing protein/two-component sensor histidine kinase